MNTITLDINWDEMDRELDRIDAEEARKAEAEEARKAERRRATKWHTESAEELRKFVWKRDWLVTWACRKGAETRMPKAPCRGGRLLSGIVEAVTRDGKRMKVIAGFGNPGGGWINIADCLFKIEKL